MTLEEMAKKIKIEKKEEKDEIIILTSYEVNGPTLPGRVVKGGPIPKSPSTTYDISTNVFKINICRKNKVIIECHPNKERDLFQGGSASCHCFDLDEWIEIDQNQVFFIKNCEKNDSFKFEGLEDLGYKLLERSRKS